MATYLIDTNILLRIADPKSEKRDLALQALEKLADEGHALCITSQVVAEFWSVATRPPNVNGLGFDIETVRAAVDAMLSQFPLLSETRDVFTRWLRLVSDHQVSGKRVHDIKLLALMLEQKITHLLTFNPRDFRGIDGVTIVDPTDLVK